VKSTNDSNTVVKNSPLGDNTAEIERCDADSDEINRKILQVIEYTFSSNIRKKIRKIIAFIINFGSNVISFTSTGNVMIRGVLLDPKANIIDLFEALVSGVNGRQKPLGYYAFIQALKDINIPSHFIQDDLAYRVSKKKKNEMHYDGKLKLKHIPERKKWKPY
jgi:hypothetical protein